MEGCRLVCEGFLVPEDAEGGGSAAWRGLRDESLMLVVDDGVDEGELEELLGS